MSKTWKSNVKNLNIKSHCVKQIKLSETADRYCPKDFFINTLKLWIIIKIIFKPFDQDWARTLQSLQLLCWVTVEIPCSSCWPAPGSTLRRRLRLRRPSPWTKFELLARRGSPTSSGRACTEENTIWKKSFNVSDFEDELSLTVTICRIFTIGTFNLSNLSLLTK